MGYWPLTSTGVQGGTELVSNGTFDSDTVWTKQACWSISGGTASCDGSNGSTSLLYAGGMLEDGKTYILNFTITDISGTLRAFPSGASSEWTGTYTSSGSYQQLMQKTHPTVTEWYFQASAGTTVSVDNVSVREYKSHATDRTVNSNHGIISGNVEMRNHGYEFDGVDDTIKIENFTVGSTATISAWARDTGDFSGQMLWSLNNDESPNRWQLYFSGGIIYLNTGDGSSNPFANSSYPTTDEWHHYTVVTDSSTQTMKLYIDGNYVGDSTSWKDPTMTNNIFIISGRYDGTQYNWEGNIADVRIYNRVLSATEISDLADGKDAGIPVGHWPLNRNTRDISGNGNHGTVVYNGPYTTGPDSETNGAIMLDGNKTRVEVSSISQISNPFTLSYRVKFNNTSGWQTMIGADTDVAINRAAFYFQKEGSSDITGEKFVFCLVQSNGLCVGAVDESTGHHGATSATEISTDTWYQVTATYDGSNIKLYVDGVLEDTKAYTGSVLNINSPIQLGAGYYADNIGDFVDGDMADVYIYDVALSDAQVLNLYNGQSVGTPVGYWPMNGSTNDNSGNGNHGILNNPVYDGAVPIGDAAYFDGASYIDINNSDTKPTGSQAFSVWYKTDTHYPTDWVQIWGGVAYSGGANIGHSFGITRQDLGGAIISDLHNAAPSGERRSMGWIGYPGEGWHLVTSVYDRDAPRHIVYVDGVKVIDRYPGNGSNWDSGYLDVSWGSTPLKLGSNSVGTGWYYSGYLRDFRIYNRALSATEAVNLYSAPEAGGNTSTFKPPTRTGMVGQWKLNEGNSQGGDQLHTNWDMESGVAGWAFDSKTDGVEAEYTADKYAGSKSAQLTNSTVSSIAFWQVLSGQTVGDRYHVSVWAKNIDCPTIPYFSSAGATRISGDSSFTGISTGEWKYYSAVFEATDANVNIYIRTTANASQGSFLVDNFSIKKIIAADQSSQGNTGTIHGDPTYSPGPYGETDGAMTFDGNDSVSIDSADWNNFTNTDDFTLSIWAKKGSDPGSGNVLDIFGKNSKYAIDYYFVGDQIRAGIRNGTDGQYQITHDVSDDMQNWTHIAMVYESEASNGLRLYVNGDLKAERTTVGLSDFSSSQVLGIGNNAALGGSPVNFVGSLADAKIYNRALAGSEISALYRRSAPARINASQNDKVTSGLVGLWSFNGPDVIGSTAYDRSGSNNNGTITGAIPDVGKVGQGMYLNGDDVINCGTDGNYAFGAGDHSLSAWVRPSALEASSTYNYIVSVGNNAGGQQSGLGIRNTASGANIFHSAYSAPLVNFSTSHSIPLDEWSHIVLVHDSGTSKLYINGDWKQDLAIAMNVQTGKCYIGTHTAGTSYFDEGVLDEIRIYNKALSATEIAELYNLGR